MASKYILVNLPNCIIILVEVIDQNKIICDQMQVQYKIMTHSLLDMIVQI